MAERVKDWNNRVWDKLNSVIDDSGSNQAAMTVEQNPASSGAATQNDIQRSLDDILKELKQISITLKGLH